MPASFTSRVADAHRRTRKPKDIVWNRLVARPLASLLLVPLESSRFSPNQITFASLAVFVAAAALLVALPGHAGLCAAIVVLEFSYVLDCADGQLARLRGTSTPVGAHLDFLMDELKAFLLVAAVGLRLWREQTAASALIEALLGLVAVASAISLTTFIRRPEYAAATGTVPAHGAGDYGQGFAADEAAATAATAVAAPDPPAVAARPPSLLARLARVAEATGKFIIHYPSYLPVVALADRLDLFFVAYVAVNAAYAARTLFAVFRVLARPT